MPFIEVDKHELPARGEPFQQVFPIRQSLRIGKSVKAARIKYQIEGIVWTILKNIDLLELYAGPGTSRTVAGHV